MSSAAEIRNVIKKLEQIAAQLEGHGTASQNTLPTEVADLKEFRDKLHHFQELSNGLEQPLKDATPLVLKVFKQMETVILFSSQVKKPNADELKQIHKILTDTLGKIQKISTPALNYQFKALREGCSASFWVILDAPKPLLDCAIEAAEFNGFKLKQQKVQEVNKWYDAFIQAIKILNDFINATYKMGLDWNPKGSKSLDELYSAMNSSTGASHPPPPSAGKLPPPPPPTFNLPPPDPHQSEEGSDRNALFAQINVGEDIMKRLKKVDKHAPLPDAVVPKQQQQQQVKAPIQQTQKVPRRYCKENWFLVNFSNEKLIEFTEEEIDMKQSLFIESCVNCGILVKGKVKSIFLQKCEKVELVFDSTVSGVDIVGGKRIKVTCLNQCPSFMVNNSESVHMTFNTSKQCEIISSKTMDLNLTYLQEDGELARDTNIPEQFLTIFDVNLNKFVTSPLDMQFG